MPLYFSLILYYLFSITNSIQVGIPDEKISFGNYTIVLDANWRWIHYPNQYTNCFDGRWTCGQNCDQCVVEGVNIDKYNSSISIRRFQREEWEDESYRKSKIIPHTFYIAHFDKINYHYQSSNLLPFYINNIKFIKD